VVGNFPAIYGTQYHVHTTVHPAHSTLNKMQLFINIISYSLIKKMASVSTSKQKSAHKKKLFYANKWDMRLEFLLLISGQTTDKGAKPTSPYEEFNFLAPQSQFLMNSIN
jgi:hypothetical protein